MNVQSYNNYPPDIFLVYFNNFISFDIVCVQSRIENFESPMFHPLVWKVCSFVTSSYERWAIVGGGVKRRVDR
jgi:hypothetical protein